MRAKCIQLFTLNMYIFYFLLLCIDKGLTISTNHHTQLRHEKHYKSSGYQSDQQQPHHHQYSRHTPATGINEAVHAFHPSNNLHLLHSLQYNSHYMRRASTTTTTTRKPYTTRQTRYKNYNQSPFKPSATSNNHQNSLKLHNNSHKQPFGYHTTLTAMSPPTTVAPENVYRHPFTHGEHVRKVNRAENPFLTTSKYGTTAMPQSATLSKSSASMQSITENTRRIHSTPRPPHRPVYRGSEEQDDYFNEFNEKNYDGSDTFRAKNYREIIADGNRGKEMNLKNVINDDDDDNGDIAEVDEDEGDEDDDDEEDEYDYLDDESTLEESGRVGSLTNEKWENYGTREAVDKSRSQIAQRSRQQMAVHNVTAHISRIYTEALCKFPKPKIIPIVAASKTYVPHCTVLHRCGDDTGCCHTDALTCVPKRTATVDLYFYVSTMEKREPSVEYLTFINHTECHCLSRHNPANLHRNNPYNGSPTAASTSSTVTESHCRCVRHFTVFHERVESVDEEDEGVTKTRCRCDCEPENVNCDWLKKGMDGFSIENRRCIEDKRCSRPTCQYGQYNTTIGRCPKVEDKLADARKLSFNETSRLRFD